MVEMTKYERDILSLFSLKLPWEKLTGKNILITGASGLIGGCLVDALLSNPHIDYNVYASGRSRKRLEKRFSSYTSSSFFHILEFDVINPIEAISISFNYIIHAAGNASPKYFAEQPVEVITANILGIDHLMRYGITHQMEKFLYISSGEVYGEGDGRVFQETDSGYVDCATVRACYPSAKRASETLCIAFSSEYGVDVSIARPCHIFGPYFTKTDNRVYAQFLRNVINQKDIVLKSSGEQYRSWCYIVDCVKALLFILLKGETAEAYNIADKNFTLTIKDFAERFAVLSGLKVIHECALESESKGYSIVKKAVFSTEKLEALGFEIEGNINDKILSTIEQCLTDEYHKIL